MSQIHHRFAKRMIDVAGGAFGLLVTSPILLISAAVLVWKVGWPVTFRQCRAGLKGKPFVIYKLKTMTDARDRNGDLEPDEKRLTTIGRVVRRFSLDELPQLWNVLKGEMSLVGPRPLRVEYLPLYSDFQRRRHDVRPGITGWAQIRGRNAITWQEKFTLDVWYVENWSLILDLKIMLATLWPVLRGSGMSQAGHVTMPPFTGDESAAERPIVDLVQQPDQPLTNVVVHGGGLWSGRQDCLNS